MLIYIQGKKLIQFINYSPDKMRAIWIDVYYDLSIETVSIAIEYGILVIGIHGDIKNK